MDYLHISQIYIIQSLCASEFHTGNKLKEDIDGYIAYAGHPILCVLENVYNKNDFLVFLDVIASEAEKGNFPIVHFESHGSQSGLHLASEEVVTWRELNEKLTKINELSKLHLIVVLGLCYGAYFIRSMDNLKRSPCLMFIGPTETIYPDELVFSLSEFYRYLIFECDGSKSFKFLVQKKLDIGGFSMTTCIHFFKSVVKLYYDKTRGCEAERARRIRNYLKNERYPVSVSVGSIKRSLVKYEKDYFRKLYDAYFFADLYPENRNRFSKLVGISNISTKNGCARINNG